jgi:hypothetical protein
LGGREKILIMQRLLIGIEDAKDIDGVSVFINGKHDQRGKATWISSGDKRFYCEA